MTLTRGDLILDNLNIKDLDAPFSLYNSLDEF